MTPAKTATAVSEKRVNRGEIINCTDPNGPGSGYYLCDGRTVSNQNLKDMLGYTYGISMSVAYDSRITNVLPSTGFLYRTQNRAYMINNTYVYIFSVAADGSLTYLSSYALSPIKEFCCFFPFRNQGYIIGKEAGSSGKYIYYVYQLNDTSYTRLGGTTSTASGTSTRETLREICAYSNDQEAVVIWGSEYLNITKTTITTTGASSTVLISMGSGQETVAGVTVYYISSFITCFNNCLYWRVQTTNESPIVYRIIQTNLSTGTSTLIADSSTLGQFLLKLNSANTIVRSMDGTRIMFNDSANSELCLADISGQTISEYTIPIVYYPSRAETVMGNNGNHLIFPNFSTTSKTSNFVLVETSGVYRNYASRSKVYASTSEKINVLRSNTVGETGDSVAGTLSNIKESLFYPNVDNYPVIKTTDYLVVLKPDFDKPKVVMPNMALDHVYNPNTFFIKA